MKFNVIGMTAVIIISIIYWVIDLIPFWASCILIGGSAFIGIDKFFYNKAKYPEKMQNVLFQLPFGGIAAYFICGKN